MLCITKAMGCGALMRRILNSPILLTTAAALLAGCSSVKDKSTNQFSIDDCPSVEEAPLVQCVKQYKLLGISPDAALQECKQNQLTGCIKNLVGTNFLAKSVRKESNGHLIDLGNQESRWIQETE